MNTTELAAALDADAQAYRSAGIIDPQMWVRIEAAAAALRFYTGRVDDLLETNNRYLERARAAEADVADLRRAFNARMAAQARAKKLWQQRTGNDATFPDHADLCTFLMLSLDMVRMTVAAVEAPGGPDRMAAISETCAIAARRERDLCITTLQNLPPDAVDNAETWEACIAAIRAMPEP